MKLEDSMRIVMYRFDCIKDSNDKLLARVTTLEGSVYNSPCYKGPPARSNSAIL
jgi:hypothetical protein